MGKYVVRSPFTAKSPLGARVMRKGEALRLSSSLAVPLVAGHLIVDSSVGNDILAKYEERVAALMTAFGYTKQPAEDEAADLVRSCLRRHQALKVTSPPSDEFLREVREFNLNSTGDNPIGKESSEKGVGEWAGYRCNIGKGCSHGCLYCYAEKMATRFRRVGGATEWLEENLKDVSTAACKRYDSTIMFPTTHDITPAYLSAYRCHLYNLLAAGNQVLVVTKPHRESIEAIVSELSTFRDQITFRFTIGGLDEETMRHWEPGAPAVEERIACLIRAFEAGFQTSVSAEPMLGGIDEAVKLYHLLAPYITVDIWFGKMNNIGSLRSSPNPEVAKRAVELSGLQADDDILGLVESLRGFPKVKWKDSIKDVINNNNDKAQQPGQGE